jgi:hypothetical protein
MKYTAVCLFVFSCLLAPRLYAQDLCTICDTLKNNVVQITTTFADGREENGFGTVIGERNAKLYVVTAKHVIYNLDGQGPASPDAKPKAVVVKFFYDQGRDHPATLLQLPGTSADIGLLEVATPGDYRWARNYYATATPKGTKVWFIGRAGKWYIPTGSFAGSINEVSPEDEIIVDINSIQPGTSGAPLVSAAGMVGLIFEDTPGGARAYAIEKVRKLVTNTWNYPWQLQLSPNAKPDPGTNTTGNKAEDKAWTAIENETKDKTKLAKVEDYVAKGQGTHQEEARHLFEGLLWDNINTYKYVLKYVLHFPTGKYIRQVEDLVYRKYTAAAYLELFPTGRYVEEARKKAAEANATEEDALWKKISEGWDLHIKEYLQKYPQGKYILQIDEHLWQKALNEEASNFAFKEKGFKKYLEYFPAGKHSATAREKIKEYSAH